MGCTSDSSVYSTSFLIDYQYNKSSPMFPLIENSYRLKNLTNYSHLKISAGFLGVCVSVKGSTECMYRNRLNPALDLGVTMYTSNLSSTSLDILEISETFGSKISHPYILITTIVLSLLLFITLSYVLVPKVPYKDQVSKFNLVLSAVITLVWGFGSIWNHVATKAGKELVEMSSMYMVSAHVGEKAKAMVWTPFAFLCCITVGLVALFFRDLRQREQDPFSDVKA